MKMRTDVLPGNTAKLVLASLKTLPQYKDKTDVEILKDYGFDVTTTLKKNSERYGVSAQDVNNLSEKDLIDASKPIIVYNASVDKIGTSDLCTNMLGRNLITNTDDTTKVFTAGFARKGVLDPTYHKLLCFKYTKPTMELTLDETNNTANDAELDAEIEAGFQLDTSIESTPTENPENKDVEQKKRAER